MEPECKICVVGAGLAGLAFSQRIKSLCKENIKVTILEARANIGGRVMNSTKMTKIPLEMGAEEVHGDDNEWFRFLEGKTKLEGFWDKTQFYANLQGSIVPINKVIADNPAVQEVIDLLDNVEESKYDCLKSSTIKEYLLSVGMEEDHLFMADSLIGAEVGSSIGKLDLPTYIDFMRSWDSGENNFVRGEESYNSILNRELKAEIENTKLNCPVESVKQVKNTCLVKFKGGEEQFDWVIMAVPLSQLKNKSIEFNPPLPQEMETMIDEYSFGSGAKLSVKLKEAVLPKDCRYLLTKGELSHWWNPFAGINSEEHVITCLLEGEAAEKVAKLEKEGKMKEYLINTLNDHLCRTDCSELIEDYLFVDWSNEPFIEGTYSCPSSFSAKGPEMFSEFHGRIAFIGEHTHLNQNQSMGGAFESGCLIADKLAKIINYCRIILVIVYFKQC